MRRPQRRRGILIERTGKTRKMIAIAIGQMSDGTMVWQECNKDREIIDDQQYMLFAYKGWQEFVPM